MPRNRAGSTHPQINIPRQSYNAGISDYFSDFLRLYELLVELNEESRKQERARKQRISERKKERERLEEIRKEYRELSEQNTKRAKEEYEARIKEWKATKEQKSQETKEEKRLADEQYEKDFWQWIDDVNNNPESYAYPTRVVAKNAKASKESSGVLSDVWHFGDEWAARRHFDVLNAIGSLVTSSIDTNGQTIQGNISLNDLRKLAAQRYLDALDALDKLDKINKRISGVENTSLDKPVDLDQYNKDLYERDSLTQFINSPETKGLSDAYKQFVVLDNKPWLSKFFTGVGNAVELGTTYDKYKSAVRDRLHREILNEYDKLVGNYPKPGSPAYLFSYNNLTAPEGSYTFDFSKKPTSLTEQLGSISDSGYEPAEGWFDETESLRKNERTIAERLIGKADSDNIALREEYEANRTHLRESEDYWNVAKGFKMGILAHRNDKVYNPYYFLYELPPMIGSSVSSPSQATSTVIKGVGTLAGVAAAPFTDGLSLNLLWISELAATPLDWLGAVDENLAETGEKRIDNIIRLLSDPSVTKDTGEEKKSTYDEVMEELRARSEAVWRARGWTDSQIKEHVYGDSGDKNVIADYITGITRDTVINTNKQNRDDSEGQLTFSEFQHPAFQDALLYSTLGLLALFDADMMRTAGELPFQKAMALIPVGFWKIGGRTVDRITARIGEKISHKIEKDAAGRVTARIAETAEQTTTGAAQSTARKYANGFSVPERTFRQAIKHGYEAGASVGDMTGFGFVGHVIGGTIGGATEGFVHAGRKTIGYMSPRLAGLIDGILEKVMIKYQGILDKITPDKVWRLALLKYGVKATGRGIAIGMSEAAEEATLYLNSKEDFAAKYGWAGMSLGDWILNDLYQGGRVIDAYMALVGIGNSPLIDDEEFWQNLKGGFMLGGLPFANPSSMILTVGNVVHGYREYKTQDAMISSGVMNREYDNVNRASLAEFARLSFQNRESYAMSTIDAMEKADSRRENPFFTQLDYDQRRKEAQTVMAMTKNKNIRGMLEAKGISYGTERYATAIADLYSLQTSLNDNTQQRNSTNSELNSIYNSLVFLAAVKGIVDDIINNSPADKEEIDQYVKNAGDEAVINEINSIRLELNLDPGSKKYGRIINSTANKLRISEARERAEQAARQEVERDMTGIVVAKTRLAHKLQGLLDMKAKHNTIDDFFVFLKDKFNLQTKRPDAKTVHDSIDKQIKDAKELLAKLTEGTYNKFNANSTDAQTLDYLESIQDVVRTKDLKAEQLEADLAMLEADRLVTLSYYDQFTYGLVKDKNGKWEYNPAQFDAKRDKNDKLLKLLQSGRIDEAQELAKTKEEPILPTPEQTRTNDYSRRVDAIMEANRRNQAIKWAINEVANGDAVNKLMLTLEDERRSLLKKALNQDTTELIKLKSSRDPFDVYDETERVQTEKTVQETVSTSKDLSIKSKYDRRRKKVKKYFDDVRKQYNKFSKSTVKAAPIPFMDEIVKGSFMLAQNASLGILKIGEFVELMKDMLPGISIKDALSSIKAGYNKRRVYYQLNDPSVLENMSTVEEVMAYTLAGDNPVTITPPPAQIPLHAKMQKRFDDDSNKIISEISSHYDVFVQDEDGVHIYVNESAFTFSKERINDYNVGKISSVLRKANVSDESFRSAIEALPGISLNFPIAEFVKYRDVDGVEDAIARKYLSWSPGLLVENGIRVRNAVISLLLGRDVSIDELNFDEFKQDILNLKDKFDNLGLTILNTQKQIYGVNKNGKRITVEADIIAVDETGKVYVIDVRSGYASLRQRWDRVSSKIGYSVELLERTLLKSIEEIINDKFKIPVKSLRVLPIVYNPNGIMVEKAEDGTMTISIKTASDPNYSTELDLLKKLAKQLVELLNETIREYNAFVQEAARYTNTYRLISELVLLDYNTALDYVTYMQLLHAQYDDLNSRIDDIKQKVQDNIDRENNIWFENAQQITDQQLADDVNAVLLRLEECCKDLDIVLQYIPLTKVTTAQEKDRVKVLYQSIFDAQKALDELLQHPEASNIDVSNEIELIARAMEILAENKENFGAMSIFMRRWWVDNFAIGPGNNTSESVGGMGFLTSGFVNSILAWTNTLEKHVLNDLDNHLALQEWYSSILNNYFSKLLNNAEEYSKSLDASTRDRFAKLILKGRNLIDVFNELYGTNPDEQFPGPPANLAEQISRMPVKWKDLYGYTTVHSPGFDAMANNIVYYVMSISDSFTRGYKTQSSPVDDPSNKSTRFTLFEDRNGEIKLRINWWDGNKWTFVELPFQTDISKYRNPSENEILRFIHVNRVNKKFERKVKAMLDYIKEHPEYTIDFTVSTNKGSIRYGDRNEHHNVSEFLFKRNGNEHDMYTISLSTKDRIGLGVFIDDRANNRKFYDVRAGSNLKERIGGFDDTYTKLHLNTQNGAVVYFYDNGDGDFIGVPLKTQRIGNDATKLVDLIYKYVTGSKTENGFDILTLLKQRLYIYDSKRNLSSYNNRNNLITINLNGDIVIGEEKPYNIYNDRQKLIDRIAVMENSTDAGLMNEKMASSSDAVFSEARLRFMHNLTLQQIALPNGFVINREDFVHKNSDGTQGSTWLGYLLRNNILGTRATGRSYKQVNIDNLVLVNKNHPIQIENTTSGQERNESRKRRISSLDAINDPFADAIGGLTMTVDEDDIDVNRGSEEQEDFVKATKEYFNKVFGTDKDVTFDDVKNKYIKQLARNLRVIGLATSEMIKLSRYAPYSAMYHEAFHKLIELVLPAKTREEFYSIYRARNGEDLTERLVAEGLADLFVDYMMARVLPKDAKWYNKIFKQFKIAGCALAMCWKYGIKNTRKMYTVYQNANAGNYANREISEENSKRFKEQFNDELYYKVGGVEFLHIADSGMLLEMVKGLGYYILETYGIDQIDPDVHFKIDEFTPNILPKDVFDSLVAKDVPVEELTAIDLAFREVLKEGKKVPIIGTKGKNKGKTIGYKQSYPNFQAISKNVADYIETILGEYRDRVEESEEDDFGEGIDFQTANRDKFDKVAHEFSKLDSLNRKIKLFFATIPYCTFDEDGKIVIDYSKNEFNCPSFAPIEEVYNVIVNDLHTVLNILELDSALRKLAEYSPMHRMVYSKYHRLISGMYTTDEQGNIKIDYDKESFAIQILNAIRSQKIDFVIALSNRDKKTNNRTVRISSSSLQRDARQFPKQWTQFLVAGQVGVFKINRDKDGNFIFRDGMGGTNGEDIFSRTANFITSLRLALSQSSDVFTLDGEEYHKDSLENVAKIKADIIYKLHTIGIMFSREALDHMLLTEYGDMGANGLLSWLSQTGATSPNNFIETLNKFVNTNGTVNKQLVESGYKNIGFVRNLAKWLGSYNRIHTQQMALGLNGKRLYSISQNSTISHIITMLNTQNLENETISTLMNFGYNLTGTDFLLGSIILKAIKQKKDLHIVGHTYIGFKTDNRGDSGSEYTKEATVDDYIAKLTMLLLGYMIFPTLSDKSTWMILSGVDIPGMQFIESKTEAGLKTVSVQNTPKVEFINRKPYIIPSDNILNQMIEYANTERLAILQCMEDLGYDTIPGYEKQGRKKLNPSEYIKNYHTKNKDKKTGKVVEPNGTRFLSLTKIVCKEVVDGKVVLKTYNLNDPNISSTELLSRANEHFFSKPEKEQKEIMALTLATLAMNEIDTAIDLGLVERRDISAKWKNALGKLVNVRVSKDERSIMNLLSQYLNESQILAVTAEILRTIPHKDYGTWAAIPQENGDQSIEKNFKCQIARSMAIAAILADATYRSIICSQEVLRCFCGHPAEFKVNYDFANGRIKDSAFDIQKRIGGMISTGDDNVLGLPGIPSTYTCAEIKDYEVSSNSDVASRLDELFLNSEIRDSFASAVIQYALNDRSRFDNWLKDIIDIFGKNKDWIPENKSIELLDFYEINQVVYNIAYSSDIDFLKNIAPEKIAHVIQKAEENANKFSASYKKDINVADGAAYITDTMCENMLRMRGAYNLKVKKAFDILRSNDTKYSWTDKREAYDIIYGITNLVTTKYTAYGFRNHQTSDVSVAYYNKFALFPLFPCLSTGKMGAIYQKMLDEKVDMVMMDSAVKVGSQGAVEFDGNFINQPFNKYVQSFAYLRRQQNTDPEEKDRSKIGSQMVKIGLQNLRKGRQNYVHARTGETVSGQYLLNEFMNSIKQLAINGSFELQNMFFKEGTAEVDAEKLSKYLKNELSTRNANKALIEAIQVVKDPVTGLTKLACPLAATPDASWIESILISTINKKIIDIVTPGNSFVQRSVFAMEGSSVEGAGSILSDANMSPEINGGNKLLMINEDGSMDAVISMDYFDEVIFKGKLRNMSFTEKRQWLIDNNIIGPNAKANTIGYRIPTLAQSSIHALRFVDVIQAVKSTIILPEEFTKITGSDFDIDHIYLASYNYNVGISEDGIQYVTTTFNPVEDDGINSNYYHQNNILDCLMTLLKDTENSMNCLYKSIDNDTELITDISDQIEDISSIKSDPYNFGTLHEQVVRKNDYITGKNGIGPFALNVTNQILTLLYNVRFKDTTFTKETGISRLDHIYDSDGNAISSWLSAFINAHVDIVKDPYISKLNVNLYTYNMLNLLIRSGFGDLSVWFLAQPIIRDMSFANENAKSQYSRDPSKAKSTYAAQEYAVMLAILKYMSEKECSKDVIERYTHSNNKRDIYVRINTIKWLKDHQNVLAEIAKNPNAVEVTVDGVKYNVADVLKTVFYAWKTLEKYAIALSNLVQHTKIDTRKHGKSLIAIQQYLDAYDKLFNESQAESIWDMRSLRDLVNGSWIELKTRLAINAPTRILNHLTFAANPEFIRAVIRFGNILSTTGDVLNTDTLEFLSKCLITAIKSRYIVRYAKEKLGKTDSAIAGLFVGPNSMNHRLIRLKNQIETNPIYARLKNNRLINQIYSELEDNETIVRGHYVQKPGFITVLDNVDDSKLNSDLLIDGWEDLLNDSDKFVRSFARDLIVYSFLTSGEFKGWNKLFKYVPPAWIRGEIDTDFESFSGFIEKTLLIGSSDYYNYLEAIVSNNFMDYRVSRRVPKINDDNTANFIDATGIIKIGKAVYKTQMDSCEEYITVKEDEYGGKGVAAYNLYKLVGFIPSRQGMHPVYARIKKRGYHDDKGHDIYEYGWSFGYAENENETFVQFDLGAALSRVQDFLNSQDEGFSVEETTARAITDVYLGRANDIVVNRTETEGSVSSNSIAVSSIADKTEAFGVEISSNSQDFWNKVRNGWQSKHPQGIVAYRKYGDNPKTFSPETVNEGWIGNPFSTQSRGEDTVQKFYDWIITGNNFGNERATEEFRQAIIQKIISAPEGSPILYYTELNRPSHATVLGYLINKVNKEGFFVNYTPGEKIHGFFQTLNITPAKSVDKKAAVKGSISNKFIGFADGIQGSSTAEYARQAGDKANVGTYDASDIIFVSIPGLRGDADVRHAQQDRTIAEALKALNSGATLVTDNKAYTQNSQYNEGEKRLAEALTNAGATYSEIVVNDQKLGIWERQVQGENITSKGSEFAKKLTNNTIISGNNRSNSEGLTKGVQELAKLGRMTEVNPDILEQIRELDKQRDDYNKTVKRSPIYIKLQNIMRGAHTVADVTLPANSSQELKDKLQALKAKRNDFVKSNMAISGADTATPEAAKILHDYIQETTAFVKDFIKEFYGIDAPLRYMEYYAGERLKNPNFPEYKSTIKQGIDVILRSNPEMGTTTAQGTIDSMNSNDNPEFTKADNVLKKRLGGSPLKVAMASEHTDPTFHSREVCRKINEDLAQPRGQRKYHMLQIMTKHDGLLLLDMLELNIPKSVHFSITSLGGTKYEPGVMKTDDLLDRIEQLIKDGKLNPKTTTIRIDPIIPGVTIPNNIAHIMDRASKMGIRSIKISIMDSYGYDEQAKERGVMENMIKLGYDFNKYYRKYQATRTTYDKWGNVKLKEGEWYWSQDANSDMMLKIYQKVDELAQRYNVYCTTCGEKPNTTYQFKRLSFSHGCLNATGVASVLGVSLQEVESEVLIGNQRPGKCNCLNCKGDILAYDDTCASQCAYCYAKHGSKTAMLYYDENGKLLDNDFTRTSRFLKQTPSPETKINIYAGTGENTDLSNFAERPVYMDSPYNFGFVQFRTVEGAFQAAKLKYADIDGHTYLDFESKLANATGAEARKIGRLIPNLNREEWDVNSSRIMKDIILKSFLQNPQALQRLLVTGNTTLTHTQDNSKWKTEFPRILMEVREELRLSLHNQEETDFNNKNEFPTDEMEHCKH